MMTFNNYTKTLKPVGLGYKGTDARSKSIKINFVQAEEEPYTGIPKEIQHQGKTIPWFEIFSNVVDYSKFRQGLVVNMLKTKEEIMDNIVKIPVQLEQKEEDSSMLLDELL